MEALLVTGGEVPPRLRFAARLCDFGLVCAADSGLDILRAWGVEPDIVVGDMDSLSDPRLLDEYPRATVIRALRDKDETDTELGLEALSSRGATRIVLAGGGGGRLDHLLAIRALFERRLRPSEWHTSNEVVYLVEEGRPIELAAAPGSLVSVFPLARGASGMESEGLKWPLAGLSWGPGGFGISNVTTERRFSIRPGAGELLVVLAVRP
jgi:thiamine pyrophosphokinase